MTFSLPYLSRRMALAVGLGCLLWLVYLLSFNGIPKANDELFLADSAQSIALHGNYWLNQTQFVTRVGIVSTVEPLQPILAAPLYWIGYHLPWAGNIHTLYLFNPLITALTAILLFYYALLRGYGERTALIGGLLYGLTTMAWPYARTFFREPLTGLNLLAAAYLWERWRMVYTDHQPRGGRWFALAVGVSALSLLSKEASLFVMPMLLLIAVPRLGTLRRHRRSLAVLIGALVLLVIGGLVLLSSTDRVGPGETTRLIALLNGFIYGLPWIPQGVAGLLISPGRGIGWFSPVLLLALASPALLPRSRWRESWLMLAMVLVFAVGYSGIRRDLWFGGAGWGARFMVPTLPLLMLAALPALERILDSARVWPRVALGALAAVGVGVQIVGVYVDIYDYSAYLQRSTGQPPWLGPAIWSVRWSQIIGGLLFMPQSHTDMMWFYKGIDGLALAVLSAGVIAAGIMLWRLWRDPHDDRRMRLAVAGACLLIGVALAAFTLWRSLPDPRYREDTPQIEALRADLERIAGPEDTVLLSNRHYASYFMNSYKGWAIWWGLPNSPGERPSPEQPAEVVSDQVEQLIAPADARIITRYLKGGETYNGHPLWLVTDASPFLEWATRPVEWYLDKYAYFVSGQDYASNARLVEYLPLRAPSASQAPAAISGARFGASIRLVGFDLDTTAPTGPLDALRPGDGLGLSVLWEALGPIPTDYTAAVHVISQDQKVYAQQDRPPVVGFAPTSKWQPGERVRDNFGLILPSDLPPGQYELWLTLYQWPSLDKLPVNDAEGQPVGDHMILTTITVR